MMSREHKNQSTSWSIFLWLLLGVFGIPADVEGKESVLLDAMQQELDRNQNNLKLEGFEGPYFMSYRVKDSTSEQLSARFGGIVIDSRDRVRNAYVEVRVEITQWTTPRQRRMSYGEMTLYQAESSLPLDEDSNAIRRALWLLTDQHYKQALTAYQRVRGASVYREGPDSGSFTREKAEVDLSQEVLPSPSLREWKVDAARWSRELVEGGEILDGTVDMSVDSEIRYFVSSDGAKIVTQKQLIGVHVYGVALTKRAIALITERAFMRPARMNCHRERNWDARWRRCVPILLRCEKRHSWLPTRVRPF